MALKTDWAYNANHIMKKKEFLIVVLFLFELEFIYSMTLNKNHFPSWIGILIVFLFLDKLFFLYQVEVGLLIIFLKKVG